MYILERDLKFIEVVAESIRKMSEQIVDGSTLSRFQDILLEHLNEAGNSKSLNQIEASEELFKKVRLHFSEYCYYVYHKVSPYHHAELLEDGGLNSSQHQESEYYYYALSQYRLRDQTYRAIESTFFSVFSACLNARGLSWLSRASLGPDLVTQIQFWAVMSAGDKEIKLDVYREIVDNMFLQKTSNVLKIINSKIGSLMDYSATAYRINPESGCESFSVQTLRPNANGVIICDRRIASHPVSFIIGNNLISLSGKAVLAKSDVLVLLNQVVDNLLGGKTKISIDDFSDSFHFSENTLSQAVSRMKKSLMLNKIEGIELNRIAKSSAGESSYGITFKPYIVILNPPKKS